MAFTSRGGVLLGKTLITNIFFADLYGVVPVYRIQETHYHSDQIAYALFPCQQGNGRNLVAHEMSAFQRRLGKKLHVGGGTRMHSYPSG